MTDHSQTATHDRDKSRDDLVLVRREGTMTHLTLNRPRPLNALTREMVERVYEGIRAAADDGSTAVLLDGAGERGFCGGGDIKAMAGDGLAAALAFLSAEYRADLATHTSAVPVVGIMDGITMGGGIGLTGHTAVRVVTERSRLAMPETRIGIVPDVGANLLLARAPGRLGELLAISSASFSGADAVAIGFADHLVHSSRLDELRQRIAQGEPAAQVAAALAKPMTEASLLASRAWFDKIADEALGSPVETLENPIGAATRLIAQLEQSPVGEARSCAEIVRSMSPTSVTVALAQLARARLQGFGLAEALTNDYRVLGRLMARADFAEGVRALLIDKDNSPRWSPARIEDLDAAAIGAILDERLTEDESPLKI